MYTKRITYFLFILFYVRCAHTFSGLVKQLVSSLFVCLHVCVSG